MVFSGSEINKWKTDYPLLTDIINLDPVFWLNPHLKSMASLPALPVSIHDMEKAMNLWERFIPFFEAEFPETQQTNGVIESPLKQIEAMKIELEEDHALTLDGELYLKCDNLLPIAGSIKARGGIYEVLQHAESLAIEAGFIHKQSNYEMFSSAPLKNLFQQYTIGVASTGNLGLSIGIMSAKLGFNVSVYMSADAKQWKKDLLRSKGATVYEFAGDFSEAIRVGREKTVADPFGYFVDDEDSKHLFLGYSVAAFRLQKQLEEKQIKVDKEHPLFVYLPCGVGGAPGGITFGLKQVFGDHVHCFFVEPTRSPSVLIGLLTGQKEHVSVQDFGIDNRTDADGLAVGRPSSFATSISEHLISGIYTVEDASLYQMLASLADSENLFLEPSATAGIAGLARIKQTNYMEKRAINKEQVTHIAWATGGALVPEEDMRLFYERGNRVKLANKQDKA